MKVFEKRTVMRTTVEKLKGFHVQPVAFQQLTPPGIFATLLRDSRKSLTEGDLEFTLWFGIFPVRWLARHEAGPTPDSFVDVMVQGPMAYWRHEHLFEEVPGGAALIDRVTLRHKPGVMGLMTRLMFDGLPLRFLFLYRHWRTRQAVEN